MNEKKIAFYERVATVLETTHKYVDLEPQKRFGRDFEEYMPDTVYTRWGPRIPGNGRFAGVGIVKYFTESAIQVMFHDPTLVKTFGSEDSAIEAIKEYWESRPKD